MTRVLLTGGSGFIAAWVLEVLLERGHSVVTTVRSEAKAQKIKEAHPKAGSNLSCVIVEDIAEAGAFDDAVVSDPPFEVVIHTASPFHFNITDVKKDLLDPAILGTTGILKAIKAKAPSVKRVVVTSSFAAIFNPDGPPNATYSEKDWNPVTEQDATKDNPTGYRASKKLAEKAAWDFVENEKANFTLTTVNPPMVLGPVIHYLNSLDAVNTSNQRIRDLMLGKLKEKISPTGVHFYIDVRDLALVHVLAAEKAGAAGKRYFAVAGYYSNKEISEIIHDQMPKYAEKLPTGKALEPGDYPPKDKLPKFDNSRLVNELGVKFRSLQSTILDTVTSLEAIQG